MEIQKEKVMKYDFAAIEKKWQDKWEQEKPYRLLKEINAK